MIIHDVMESMEGQNIFVIGVITAAVILSIKAAIAYAIDSDFRKKVKKAKRGR